MYMCFVVKYQNPLRGLDIFHQRTKHIEIDLHFIWEWVSIGDLRVLHVPTSSQYAVIFTKGLPFSVFTEFRSSLNMCSG